MVTAEDFMNKADELFGKSDPKKPGGGQSGDRRMDLGLYLDFFKIGYKIKTKGTRTIYALNECPFDSSHVNNDAAFFQDENGKLGFKCFHDSCQGKGWKEAKAKISGDVSLGAFMVGGDGDGEQKLEWPEPKPIKAELKPVEAMREGMIPAPFLPMIRDVCHRMSIPLDFVAIPIVIVAGSVIGTGCRVKPKRKDDWAIVPNLWGGIMGPPSRLKSPALEEIVKKQLGRLESEEIEKHKTVKASWLQEVEGHKLKKSVLVSEYKNALKKEIKKCKTPVNF